MTKKEMFEEIKTVVTDMGRDDIVEFCNKEIELLNKRTSKESKAQLAKVEERAKLGEQILAVLAEATEPMRTMELANAVGISPQKATAILKELKAEDKVVANVAKKITTYVLA